MAKCTLGQGTDSSTDCCQSSCQDLTEPEMFILDKLFVSVIIINSVNGIFGCMSMISISMISLIQFIRYSESVVVLMLILFTEFLGNTI